MYGEQVGQVVANWVGINQVENPHGITVRSPVSVVSLITVV